MNLKPEQLKEIQDGVGDALNHMLPKFVGDDPMSILTTAMEARIGHVNFPDGRVASISIVVEIEAEEPEE